MNEKNKILKAVKHPGWVFGVILRRLFARVMDDKTFIKWDYFSGMGRFPNMENPTTFNEKLQWLKLNDIHPEYTQLVDKYEAKEYVTKLISTNFQISLF